MPYQNREQLRAASALEFAKSPVEKGGKDGGNAIKKIPAMIKGNGLLASIAFSIELNNKGARSKVGYGAIFDAIAKHLSNPEIGIVESATSANLLIDTLSQADSQTLKYATAEALEWLGFARRFVKPESDS